MKSLILIISFITFSLSSFGQDITGQWNGVLKVQGMQLRIVFNIEENENGYQSTMDSPDQGAKGIPVTSTTFENSVLNIIVESIGLEYEGTLNNENEIIGSFSQGSINLPLDLSREKVEVELNIRPQEPKEPFTYYSEEVTIPNKKAGIELAGTLTLPSKDGKFPVVVLISGSGPQNRDEELMGHKPFLVLSDFLTKNGIAVLRYDDRGTASSTGDFSTVTTLDLSSDVKAVVKYLKKRKEIDKRQIGLIGHSEGGIIAPMVASRCKNIAFIVLLAGTGIPGDELLLLQQKLIGEVSGVNKDDLLENERISKQAFEIVRNSSNTEDLRKELTEFLELTIAENPSNELPANMTEEEFILQQVDQIASPWMQYFIKHDPAPILEKVKCPVLALNGDKDLQVPSKENLGAIKNALENGGNKDFKIVELPSLNHLFQECETGSPAEYQEIQQTFSPIAMTEILNWISKQVE